MLHRVAILVIAFGLLGGLAAASCTPGYAGSGYYQQRDCGLRLGARAYASPGYTHGYGYGVGYGGTIDTVIPTLYGPVLSLGYPSGYVGAAPYVPSWYAAPYGGRAPGVSVAPGLRYSPQGRTRMRLGSIRPGLRSGLGELARMRKRSPSDGATQLAGGVWINP